MKRALLCTAAVCFLLAPAGLAQTSAEYSPPRTADGHPDFHGVWTNASLTKVERVPEFKDLVISADQARQWERDAAAIGAQDSAPTDPSKGAPEAGTDPEGYNFFWIDPGKSVGQVNGEYRSSWIVDPPNGRVPYTPAGRAAMMKPLATFNSYDNPEERIPIERCLIGFGSTGGPPMLNALYNNHHMIVQTPDAIAINVEMIHDTRIIHMNGEHKPTDLPRYLGSSVGRWEGDTLVVETTGFKPLESLRVDWGVLVYIPPDAKVTERFTLISDEQFLYQFMVEHPTAYTQPWKGELTFRRSPANIYEYACHEGNYSVPNILGGARAQEREGRTSTRTSPRGRLDRPAPTDTKPR